MANHRPTRRDFTVTSVLALLGGATITVSGCGGGQGPSGPSNPGGAAAGGTATGDAHATISGNHGHAASVASAQLTAGGGVTVDIRGTATHTHRVALSAADIATLQSGGTVARESTDEQAHRHLVTFSRQREGDPPGSYY